MVMLTGRLKLKIMTLNDFVGAPRKLPEGS